MAKKLTKSEKVILKEFGKNLNELLKTNDISKKELRYGVGVHANMVTRWSKGLSNPSLTSIYLIIDYFNKEKPQSTPFQALFPDLIKYEIKSIKENIKKEYEEKCKKIKELEKQNIKYVEEIKQLRYKVNIYDKFIEHYIKIVDPKIQDEVRYSMSVFERTLIHL